MTEHTLDQIDPGTSVLFLGSGFTAKAKNILNEPVPTGKVLREKFAEIIGEAGSEYDLRVLAEELAWLLAF